MNKKRWEASPLLIAHEEEPTLTSAEKKERKNRHQQEMREQEEDDTTTCWMSDKKRGKVDILRLNNRQERDRERRHPFSTLHNHHLMVRFITNSGSMCPQWEYHFLSFVSRRSSPGYSLWGITVVGHEVEITLTSCLTSHTQEDFFSRRAWTQRTRRICVWRQQEERWWRW